MQNNGFVDTHGVFVDTDEIDGIETFKIPSLVSSIAKHDRSPLHALSATTFTQKAEATSLVELDLLHPEFHPLLDFREINFFQR